MTTQNIRPIPNAGFFTAFVHDGGIDCLIRSADWYKLPPIQRYLYNMAASEIRMEDAKTETRVYTFERFEALRVLIDTAPGKEDLVSLDAFYRWFHEELAFGVVHLDSRERFNGDLLVGDDPWDIDAFDKSGSKYDRAATLRLLTDMRQGSPV